ncbi:RNA-directed DNA polymerase, eukaryota [Tanacetum coccineum]
MSKLDRFLVSDGVVALFPSITGCNASFVALIPKVTDAKFVKDYRPISLIGCVYKVVTKIMANRLAMVIDDIVSNTQSAFVDFAKAYDSVRWDFLIDVLEAFGFGPTWCKWVRGTFCYAKGSILINGSPSSEFQFHRGLKQEDPLSPFLFILVMESLHISVSRAVQDRQFIGFSILILQSPACLGVGIQREVVEDMANSIGCSVMQKSFRYLGVTVGEYMSQLKPWNVVVSKLKAPIHGPRIQIDSQLIQTSSLWNSILKEVSELKNRGFDFLAKCSKRVGDGLNTIFWLEEVRKWNNLTFGVEFFEYCESYQLLLQDRWHYSISSQ